jgi:serine/threonine protein kinase
MEAHLSLEEGPLVGNIVVLLKGQRCRVGQGPGVDFDLKDPALQPVHAIFSLLPQGLAVQALGEKVALGAVALSPGGTVAVPSGHLVRVGQHAFRVEVHGLSVKMQVQRAATSRLVPLQSQPLQALEGYRLEGEIGRGAFGHVYAGVRLEDGRRVAIKVLAMEHVPGSMAWERFRREARASQVVKSERVVEVFEVVESDGNPAIVMELVEGPSARDLLQVRGALPIGECLQIAVDVAEALALAARAGLVHRDVKPANVLVCGGRAKLADFGVAKDLEWSLASLTKSGQGLGSMSYMAPEQLEDSKYADARADVYGLGATLYHLLTGDPPILIGSVSELERVFTETPSPVTHLRPECPDDVQSLVARLLAKEPEDRPPPWEVLEALQGALAKHSADG